MKEQFKNIFKDIQLLYAQFIHWNISKVIINTASFWLALLLSFPVFVILALIMYVDSIAWFEVISNYVSSGSLGLSVIAELSDHLYLIIFEFCLLIFSGMCVVFWYSYKNLLISNLYLKYIDWEKIAYLRNAYFDFKKIFPYLKLMILILLVLLIPVVIFVISFFILIFIFGWVDNAFKIVDSGSTNYFSVTLFVSLFLNLLVFLYLAYRMSFAYIILMDQKNYPEKYSASFYLKESFAMTKWVKIFKFILLLIIFTLLMFPIDYIGSKVETLHDVFVTLYTIMIFLVLGWVFEMWIVSMYRRVMLDKNNTSFPVEIQEVSEEKKEVL